MSVTTPPLLDMRGPLRGREIEVLTPEGIPLKLEIAPLGDRLAAFLLDWMIIILLILATALVMFFAAKGSGGGESPAWAIMILIAFLLRNFYFAWFEVRGNGSTPGKRRVRIRVVDARGGPLRTEAVLARNLTREVEIWLPLSMLLGKDMLFPGAEGWMVVGASLWVLILALMPLFNRDRQRVGDLVAGTMVVVSPKGLLLPDLSAAPKTATGSSPAPRARYTFTREQLGIYGIYELEVLEKFLREKKKGQREALEVICEKVKRKIGWSREAWDVEPRRFLLDFYAAQRAHLEQKMLFGERKERKKTTRGFRRRRR
jgi:uncharacterized RDD family membrane protein YckC